MSQEEIYHSLAGELGITLAEKSSPKKEILTARINELLANDFNKLISILYRLDINESKLRLLLQQQEGEDAAGIITDLIIERQLQKIKSREEFRPKQDDIDENEKW